MNKILSALILIAGITLTPFASKAQEQEGCFMLDPNGQPIDLGHLCGEGSIQNISTPGLFRIPIKRREAGIPIIDVMFNGRQTFEMMLDTGATATIISTRMAQVLGVRAESTGYAQTAGGVIKHNVGRVASAQAGGAVVRNLVVGINPHLSIGLLGQNFFGSYDVTIKKNMIEFRVR
ncbi:MAG: TIGR02281 family clan AA aspartic protease [Xenococcaceae cyanobacterium]